MNKEKLYKFVNLQRKLILYLSVKNYTKLKIY